MGVSYYIVFELNNKDSYCREAKGRVEGISIGEAKGESKKAIEIARAMLLEGDSKEKIAKITGLSVEEIEKL